MHLMHGFGNNAGRLPHPRLGGGDLEFEPWILKGVDAASAARLAAAVSAAATASMC